MAAIDARRACVFRRSRDWLATVSYSWNAATARRLTSQFDR